MIPVPLLAGWLARRLLARNPALTTAHAARQANVISWALVLLLAVGAFLIWDWRDDKAAVRQANAERIEAGLQAERKASADDVARRAALEAENAAARQRMKEAENADPEAARAPAGRVSRAAAERLRNH